MPVKYSLVELPNLNNPEEPAMFYARAQSSGIIMLNQIIEEISYASSLTDGDVLNAIRGLIRAMRTHLAAGRIVNLGELGSFRFEISSSGAATKEEFNQSNIKRAKFCYRPGSMVKDIQSNLRYERVEPLPRKKKAEGKQGGE